MTSIKALAAWRLRIPTTVGAVVMARSYARHFESQATVNAPAERLFAYLDDQRRLSAHMNRSSWMMLGSTMKVELDAAEGRAVGSRIRLAGGVLGVPLHLLETVILREPPTGKTWETIGAPSLLVIGRYRMGFAINPLSGASELLVFIDYDPPEGPITRWLGLIFGKAYARWCTTSMTRDAVEAFR